MRLSGAFLISRRHPCPVCGSGHPTHRGSVRSRQSNGHRGLATGAGGLTLLLVFGHEYDGEINGTNGQGGYANATPFNGR